MNTKNNKKILTSFLIFITFLTLVSCWNNTENTNNNINEETENINSMIEDTNNTEANNNDSQMETSWDSNWEILKLEKKYISPGWEDDVVFNINIENWVIQNVNCDINKANRESREYIGRFNDIINTVIIWKTIEEAKNIDIVWWASLTTNAFIQAINEI